MASPTPKTDLMVYSLTARERDAVEQFCVRLHEVLPRDKLRSIILYGSKARGDSQPHSDIDLLVVHYDLTPKQQEQLDEFLWQFGMDLNGELDLQILTQSCNKVVEMENIGEPLAQNIQREGIVLEGEPIVVKKIDKIKISERELARAKKSLVTAEYLLQGDFYDKVVSEAYYSFFYAARAALVAKSITPQSHEGTKSLFGLHLVEPGLVPSKFGHRYGKMLKDRVEADYEREYEFTRADAERALERARELLSISENLLPQLLASS